MCVEGGEEEEMNSEREAEAGFEVTYRLKKSGFYSKCHEKLLECFKVGE